MHTSFALRRTCNAAIAAACLLAAGCHNADRTPPAAQAPASTPTLALLAGAPSGQGYQDGARADARFSYLAGMRFDAAGNMFVADARNAVIRKIDRNGAVSTLAGSAGQNGSADGAGAAARFNYPSDVALDAAGNVYVADSGNSVIRRITPAGVVTTLAGAAGQYGSDDGKGAAARFSGPSGVVLDQQGNLYVADTWNGAIRKITPDGEVSTLAHLNSPGSLAINPSGELFATCGDNTISRITPSGVVSTVAGTAWQSGSTDGAAASALFNGPSGISIDRGGNLIVMDGYSHTLRMITPSGAVRTIAGSPGITGNDNGPGPAARFKGPGRVLADDAGNVYISDNNSAIRRLAADGLVSTWAGVARASGSADGKGEAARFSFPNGIAIDAQKNLYIADQDNSTVRKIDAAGVVSTVAGKAGVFGYADGTGAAANFAGVGGMAVDQQGNLYVSEFYNHTVRKIAPGGVVTTLAGAAGQSGYADGAGGAARFNSPNNLAVDAQGNVYVSDYGNNAVRKITPQGVVSTFAGTTEAGSADGAGSAARFNGPNSLALDATGNLWLTDAANNTVRKITPAGVVSTVAGKAGAAGNTDAVGAAARFSYPWGIAVDSTGEVYVADSGNNSVRRIDSAGKVSTVAGGGANYQNVSGKLPGGLAYPIGLAVDPGKNTLYITLPDAVMKATLK
jgi:sugar lactone lactonase YvrE